MPGTTKAIFDTTLQKADRWVSEVQYALGAPDGSAAYRALRAVLQALRDQLDVAQATQLGAQLPILIRGVFYEGWRPVDQGKVGSKVEFLELVMERFGPDPHRPPAGMVQAVFDVLHSHVGSEFEQAFGTLPRPIQELWAPAQSAQGVASA